MTAHATIGVDDDLASGETGVAHGAADDETSRGIHVDLGILVRDALLVEHGFDDMLDHVGIDLSLLDIIGMLCRDEYLLDGDRLVIDIAYRHLRLAVRSQVFERAILAHLGETLGQAMREIDGHGHELGGFVAGKPEHHALVASAEDVELVRAVFLELGTRIDALGDVGALLVYRVDDTAGVAVKAELGARVADLANGLAHNLVDVDVGLRADLARDHDQTRARHGLAGNAGVLGIGGHAVGGNVTRLGELDFLGENRVEDGIGDLVADLVGMSLGHGFRSE